MMQNPARPVSFTPDVEKEFRSRSAINLKFTFKPINNK